MELKKINLDGIDYQAEESVIKALQKADAKAKKAEEDACESKKALDKAIADVDVNIRMIDQGSCESNIIIGVSELDFKTAMNAIYKEFVPN